MNLVGVPADRLAEGWPMALPYVERALQDDAGHFTAEDVREAIANRRMQLWLLSREAEIVGAVVTEISEWPRVKVCRLVLAGADDGYRDEWLSCRPVLEAWAKAQGCGLMEAYGRPGWQRVMPHARRRIVLEWSVT